MSGIVPVLALASVAAGLGLRLVATGQGSPIVYFGLGVAALAVALVAGSRAWDR